MEDKEEISQQPKTRNVPFAVLSVGVPIAMLVAYSITRRPIPLDSTPVPCVPNFCPTCCLSRTTAGPTQTPSATGATSVARLSEPLPAFRAMDGSMHPRRDHSHVLIVLATSATESASCDTSSSTRKSGQCLAQVCGVVGQRIERIQKEVGTEERNYDPE